MKRGLRLRLISSMRHLSTLFSDALTVSHVEFFAKEVIETVIVFQRLDPYFQSSSPTKGTAIPSFTVNYLERRVLNQPTDGLPRIILIRRVAERLHKETTDDRELYHRMKESCHLAVTTYGAKITCLWQASQTSTGFSIETYAFVVAMYTKTLPIVEEWIATRKHGLVEGGSFGYAPEHAARHGDRRLFVPMLTHSYNDELQFLRLQLLHNIAHVGHVEDMHFIFNYKAEEIPWEYTRDKAMRPLYRGRDEYGIATMHTPNRDIFDFLTEKRRLHCIDRGFGEKEYTAFLRRCARKDWADMATCYLDIGASVDGLASPT
jgi:hypothetical protein